MMQKQIRDICIVSILHLQFIHNFNLDEDLHTVNTDHSKTFTNCKTKLSLYIDEG